MVVNMCNMREIVFKILQGSAVTETMLCGQVVNVYFRCLFLAN